MATIYNARAGARASSKSLVNFAQKRLVDRENSFVITRALTTTTPGTTGTTSTSTSSGHGQGQGQGQGSGSSGNPIPK